MTSSEQPDHADHPDHEVLAPVPQPGVSVDPPGPAEVGEQAPVPDAVAGAAYDDETDLAQPVHHPPVDGFTPYGGQLVEPESGAAYDIDRDTAP